MNRTCWGSPRLGLLLPLGYGHGPFARLGARGYMFGNEAVWLSNFEVPAFWIGYQYQVDGLLLEAAARTGMIVTGRHTAYVTLPNGIEALERRKLGQPSAEYGGHVAVGYGPLFIEGEGMRVAVADALGTPLDVFSLRACVAPAGWGICLDGQSWSAEVPRLDGSRRELTVSYAGISIGLWSPSNARSAPSPSNKPPH